MKPKIILIIVLFIALWLFLKNFKTIFNDFQNSKTEAIGKTIAGKKEGEWKSYYATGQIKEVEHYKNDILNGPFSFYYTNGNKRATGNYRNGLRVDSFILYHSNGLINSAEWRDSQGKTQGVFKIFHDNGKPSQIGKMLNGKLDDTSKTYYENGIIKEIEFYSNNARNGNWLYFNESGKLIKTEVYKNDKLIK